MLAVAGLLVASPSLVKAEDHSGHAANEVHTEAPKIVTLEDGTTKVEIDGDTVSVVAADGTKTPAPDGEHKDTEGHVWTVKEGKLVQ